VDFNPTVDRLRVVTSTGLNFRLNPVTGVLATVDTSVSGATTTLDSVAYTNGHGDTATTEYALDAVSNSLYIVNPPNAGTTTNALAVTLSGSPLDFVNANGFDIQRSVRVATSNMPVGQGKGYAVLTIANITGLYSIDLVTGAAVYLGGIGNSMTAIAGLAIAD
jgi:hypothetical protein